jgi:hypothetical protein
MESYPDKRRADTVDPETAELRRIEQEARERGGWLDRKPTSTLQSASELAAAAYEEMTGQPFPFDTQKAPTPGLPGHADSTDGTALEKPTSKRSGDPTTAHLTTAPNGSQSSTTTLETVTAVDGPVPVAQVKPTKQTGKTAAPTRMQKARETCHSPSEKPSNAYLDEALRLHALGWRVFPLASRDGQKKPPRGCQWAPLQTKSPSVEWLRSWFGKRGVNGLAVIPTNNLCIRDFDTIKSYDRWKSAHPDLAAVLPTVRTRRGRHVYFRCAGVQYQMMDDGELITGSKHYAALPPSTHPLGGQYVWEIQPSENIPLLAESFLHDMLSPAKERPDPLPPLQGDRDNPPLAPNDSGQSCPRQAGMKEEAIDAAIRYSLPKAPGQRHRLIWPLVRAMRNAGMATTKDCRPHVMKWHELALPVIGTKEWAETWGDFLRAWGRYDPDRDEIIALFKNPERLDPYLVSEYGHKTAAVEALCRRLQFRAGDRPFYLSSHALKPAGIHQETLSGELSILIDEEYLELRQKGSYSDNKASTYLHLRTDT